MHAFLYTNNCFFAHREISKGISKKLSGHLSGYLSGHLSKNLSGYLSGYLSGNFARNTSKKFSYNSSGKFLKKSGRGFLRDESGVLEPQADLLSTAIAVIGFVIFAVLLSQGYLGYEDRSFALENYESASLLAESLANSPVLRGENPELLSADLLSAGVLDRLSGSGGENERERLFAAFSGNYVFIVEVKTLEGKWEWKIIPDDRDPVFFLEKKDRVAASVPVVIELNPAESVPGTLTVVLYQPGWV